jgi:hypothetical protein
MTSQEGTVDDLAGQTGDFAGFVGELKGESSDYTV